MMKRNDEMSYSVALVALKQGQVATRLGWNGKDMYLFMVKARNTDPNAIAEGHCGMMVRSYIAMKTVQGYAVPWLASQSDMLDDDWVFADNVEQLYRRVQQALITTDEVAPPTPPTDEKQELTFLPTPYPAPTGSAHINELTCLATESHKVRLFGTSEQIALLVKGGITKARASITHEGGREELVVSVW